LFERHLRQQVLDFLDAAYPFQLEPALVEREYATILQAAEEALGADATTQAERETLAAELRGIAERRVRLGAVIAEMARRYEVRVTAAEVESQTREGETRTQTSERILEDKMIAWFLSRAKVSERQASAQELEPE
jgi:trigger factor